MKKTIQKIAAGFAVVALFFCADVYAVTTSTPTIAITKTKDTSVTLKVTSTLLAKKNVKIKVRIDNKDTDKSETKIFEKKLSKNGVTEIKIDGLTKDAEYAFKSMIKKSSDNRYSAYSESVSVNASGGSAYNPKISVTDTTVSAVMIKVSSAELKKKKVKIKVQVENKDNDTIETRTFTQKLNSKGDAKLEIGSLKKDTDYSFKVSIKKDKDKSYSAYSAKKDAKTD